MSLQAFQAAGQNLTQNVAVLAAATALAMNKVADSASSTQYWIFNSGPGVVFFEAGANGSSPTAALATSQAIPPNALVIVTAAPAAAFSFIAAATGNTVYVTPGEGM